MAALAAAACLFPASAPLLLPLLAAAAWLVVASIAASHWVYDRSDLYRFGWLGRVLKQPVRRWATLHAGFDETTAILAGLLPGEGTVIDFHHPGLMTEGSIA